MVKQQQKRGLSCSLAMVLLGVIFVAVSAAAIGTGAPLLYLRHKDLDRDVAELNARIAREIEMDVATLLDRGENIAQNFSPDRKRRHGDQTGAAARYFVLSLVAWEPNITSASITLNNTVMIARRRGRNEVRLAIGTLGADGISPARAVEIYTNTNANKRFRLTRETVERTTFTPRTEPLYVLAKKTPGKAVYAASFATSADPETMLTVARTCTVTNGQAGVISLTMPLARFNDLLLENKEAAAGKLFLRDAASMGRKPTSPGDTKSSPKKLPVTLGTDLLAVADACLALPENKTAFDSPGVTSVRYQAMRGEQKIGPEYYVSLAPLGQGGVRFGTVIPREDFMGAIKRGERVLKIVVPGLILLAGILGILFTFLFVSVPISRMRRKIEHLQNLRFVKAKPIRTPIWEIQRMGNAVNGMEETLHSFRKYAPVDLVRGLINEGQAATLGWERKEITIFYVDIEDFRQLSREHSPEMLMEQLSDYMQEVSDVVLDNGGTVDKYLGDKVLAFFGAPNPQDDHAARACSAALSCLGALKALNRKWAGENKPVLKIRIGIHTGDTFVGNIGTKRRMSYSVLGESVYTALRLKEISRDYGSFIFISERTHEQVEDQFLSRPLDVIHDPQWNKGLAIYGLLGKLTDDGSMDELELFVSEFHIGFQAFWARDFRQALMKFQEVQQWFPHDGGTKMYIERCRAMLRKSSGDNWDNVVQIDKRFLAAIEEEAEV